MLKKRYRSYNKYFLGPLFQIKLEDNLIPQGICYKDETILISCYTMDKTNSKVCEFNKNGFLKNTIVLDNNSHVGGISYDKIRDLIWICDKNGYVSCYFYEEFINNNLKNKKTFLVADDSLGGTFLKENDKLVCSYLTYFNNKLYVGSFNKKRNGLIKVFNIKKRGSNIKLEYFSEFIVPRKIQGVAFYQKNKNKYMFLSSSYGRKKDSTLFIYKYDLMNKIYTKDKNYFKLPPMLEQITLDNNANILLLFESFAKKYSYNAKVVIDEVCILDTKEIINDYFKDKVC